MNTITIELCQEDRARLDAILAALKGLNCKGCVESATKAAVYTAKEVMDEQPTPQSEEQPSTEDTPKDEPAPVPAPEPMSVDELRHIVSLAVSAGKKAEARAIITAYGNKSVSEVPENKRAEAAEKLRALLPEVV